MKGREARLASALRCPSNRMRILVDTAQPQKHFKWLRLRGFHLEPRCPAVLSSTQSQCRRRADGNPEALGADGDPEALGGDGDTEALGADGGPEALRVDGGPEALRAGLSDSQCLRSRIISL